MKRILAPFVLSAAVFVVGHPACAEPPPKKAATTPAAAQPIEPPQGFWSHAKTQLYVSVEKAPGQPEDEAFTTQHRRMQLGGPPPTQGQADDVFLPAKYERRGNTFIAAGKFNWDSSEHEIELEITWTERTVTIHILRNPGYAMYPTGKYVLKREKR